MIAAKLFFVATGLKSLLKPFSAVALIVHATAVSLFPSWKLYNESKNRASAS